jgi:hypothetical protein
VVLFLREADLQAFEADWKTWAAQFGTLLLAYVGGVCHRRAVYDGQPMPLRVDFAFRPASDVDDMAALPLAPVSVAAMVWYDATGGALCAQVEGIWGLTPGYDPRGCCDPAGVRLRGAGCTV